MNHDNFQFKELNDDQFIKLIEESKYFDKCVKFKKILVRNTLDHYQEKPLHTTRIVTKEDFMPINATFRSNIKDIELHAEKEVNEFLKNELSLYNKIKEYKLFFGLDITKNVMVTIVYYRNMGFADRKQVITYII